jgi:hypothetical protein
VFGAGIFGGLEEDGEGGLGEDEGAFAGRALAVRNRIRTQTELTR